MHPAFSVVFLTTLIGAGQGLFLAAILVDTLARADMLARPGDGFLVGAGVAAIVLMIEGLLASFAHLGRPERAWRSASQWRTSWLSREVIVLPACIAVTALWTWMHASPDSDPVLRYLVGLAGVLAMLALFVCTGMIYACLRFIQEWHSPLTVLNFTLLGCASGTTLAAALAAFNAPALAKPLAAIALVLTVAAFTARGSSLLRNIRLAPKSSLQSAIGVRHPHITQRSMGMMGGSFNTREFFHGKSDQTLARVRYAFLSLGFAVPMLLLILSLSVAASALLTLAVLVQMTGLVAERWYFFAEARHPQNLYYQTVG